MKGARPRGRELLNHPISPEETERSCWIESLRRSSSHSRVRCAMEKEMTNRRNSARSKVKSSTSRSSSRMFAIDQQTSHGTGYQPRDLSRCLARTNFIVGCHGTRRRASPLLRAPRRGRPPSTHAIVKKTLKSQGYRLLRTGTGHCLLSTLLPPSPLSPFPPPPTPRAVKHYFNF